jgi:hypothetical protein
VYSFLTSCPDGNTSLDRSRALDSRLSGYAKVFLVESSVKCGVLNAETQLHTFRPALCANVSDTTLPDNLEYNIGAEECEK